MIVEIFVLIIAVVVFLVYLLLPYKWTSYANAKLINMIPGPKHTFFFGNIIQLNVPEGELIPLLVSYAKTYGNVFKIWVLGIPEVFLTDPDDVEVVLNSRQHSNKSDDYEMLHEWLGTGLLTSSGDKWHAHRKILTPAFHFKILESYLPVFSNNARVLVHNLRDQCDSGGPSVLLHKFVTLCTLDIICDTAMGVHMNAQNGGQSEYVRAVKRFSELFYYRQMAFWLYRPLSYSLSPTGREFKKVIRVLHNFTEGVIKERRQEYRASKADNLDEVTIKTSKKHLTFLDLLIEVAETEGVLTDVDIREEVDTFMFEGHDTTSAAITWTIYLLGGHKEVQERVIEELREIFGDSDRDPDFADLQNMKYLEMVIKESLRLFPSVPAFSRKSEVECRVKDYVIPPGTNIPIVPYIMHRNPEVFPDPEEFNPDHFLPERVHGRHPFAYLPFSAGPRNCIGQKFAVLEEKVVISTILRNFHVTSLDKMADLKLLLELVLRPPDNLQIQLKPRDQA